MKKIKNVIFMIMALSLIGCDNNASASVKPSDSSTSTSLSTSTSQEEVKLIGISIEDYPLKTEYEINETLDIQGMTIKLNYNDGTSKVIDVTMDMITIPDMTIVGKTTVTISYGGFNATYNIIIKDSSIQKSKPTIKFLVDNVAFENGTQFAVDEIKDITVDIPELNKNEYEVFYTKDNGKTNLGSQVPTEIGVYAINVHTFETANYESVDEFRWYEIIEKDNRITPTFTFSIENGTMFDEGKVPEITAYANEENVKVKIYYTKDNGETNLGEVAPITPGTYAINIESIADDTYKKASDFRYYTIKPSGTLDIVVTFSEEREFTYDGNSHTPTIVSITNNVDYKVHYEQNEQFYSDEAPSEKGNYSMVVTLINANDGTLVRPWWCTFVIL